MFDFLARILRNNTPAPLDWLGRHPNAQLVSNQVVDGHREIQYCDGGATACFKTDELGNVLQVVEAAR